VRCLLTALSSALILGVLIAPVAWAQNSGQGAIGEANDKVITNAGFILIAFFPLFIFAMSLLQGHLEKRKDARKAAAKAAAAGQDGKGGW